VSRLEAAERLEQLRWLESGVALHSFEVVPQGPSVDTAEDLERVRASFLAGDRA
jgi:CMP-2-keto-3-deoxyoctulosonic acid synthetase